MRRISPHRGFRSIVYYLLGIAFIAVLLGELLPWAWRFVPMAPSEQLYAQTELTRELQQRCDPAEGRVLAITPRRAWSLFRTPQALLPPNSATVYDYHSVQGYDSLSIDQYYSGFAAKMAGGTPAPIENGNMMLLQNYSSPLLGAAAVKWIVSSEPLRSANLELLWYGEGAYLYQTNALPRYMVLGRGGAITEPTAVDTGLNYVKLDMPDASGGSLLAADAWYPGWHCFAEQKAVPIERSGDAFRRVTIPNGATRLFMAYYPATVLCGVFLSLTALAAIIGVGCASFSRFHGTNNPI